jgi:CDP-diacylglycerol---serine O-phosphatidyltransferase
MAGAAVDCPPRSRSFPVPRVSKSEPERSLFFQPFPLRYVIPNAVTALSIVLACWGLIQAHMGQYPAAAWSIVWCALLDRIDGAVARFARASSEFGRQLDSLADFVAFCVAPGLIAYLLFTGSPRYSPLVAQPVFHTTLASTVIVYIVAGGIRLARFNITATTLRSGWYEGLTTTFAGLILVTFLLCGERYSWSLEIMESIPLLLIACSVLMLSNLPLPKSLRPEQRGLFAFVAASHVVVYVLGVSRSFPIVLLLFALAYPLLGFFLGLRWSRQTL